MITSNFSGNLGNSLIQYLIARIVADKNGYEFGFNPQFNYDYHGGYNQLDFLALDYGKQHNATFHQNPDGIYNIWYEKFDHINYPNGDSVDYHPYQPDIWKVPDGSKLVIRCCQDENYFQDYKEKIITWLQYKQEFEEKIDYYLFSNKIFLGEDTCVINVRGGAEYKSLSAVLLQRKYWGDAINLMIQKNSGMKFLCITDDVPYGKELFGDLIPVLHINIGGDYYVINHAKNLIISNSSFAIIPTWTNHFNPYVIAPFGWARYNTTDGKYWASSDIKTFGWNFLDREGNLS